MDLCQWLLNILVDLVTDVFIWISTYTDFCLMIVVCAVSSGLVCWSLDLGLSLDKSSFLRPVWEGKVQKMVCYQVI